MTAPAQHSRPPAFLLNMLYGRNCSVEYPRYSKSEESALAAATAFNDDSATVARDELIMSVVPLAVKIAKQTCSDTKNRDDVIDEAVLELFSVVGRFNPQSGRLTTLTALMVRQAVVEYQRYCRGIISGPRHFHWGTASEDRKEKMLVAKNPTGGLDFVDIPNGEVPIEDRLDQLLMLGKLQTWIAKRLTRREKDILHRRFHLDETLKAIGKHYGLSRERIRQIESASLDKLRKAAGVEPQQHGGA